jgi:hypothetical protein
VLAAAHIFRVTKDKLCVHGLTGYFKVTRANKLYFLFASGITVDPQVGSRVIESISTITGKA